MVEIGLGQLIKDLRLKRGLSQNKLAQLIRVQRSYISELENGRRKGITLNTVRKLARALGVKPGLFLDETEGMLPVEIPSARPTICPDDKCGIIFTDFDKAYFDKGFSFNCVGQLAEPHEFQWREITHRNTHSHCIYTPLKGLSRFLITPEDAWGSQVAMAQILKVGMPIKCDECGETDRIGTTYLKVGAKYYCTRCCVRLGIWRWDGQRYILTNPV